MGFLGTLWMAAKPYRLLAVQAAGQYAQQKIESGEDMGIRDWKLSALTREQRQERREAGDAWWQQAARQERRAGRRERRDAGEAWWQISGNADEQAAPVVLPPNLGARMPGPGMPGARTTGGTPQADEEEAAPVWWQNPLYLAAAAGAAWLLLKKKK